MRNESFPSSDEKAIGKSPAAVKGGQWFRVPAAILPLLTGLSKSEITSLLGVLYFANNAIGVCRASVPTIAKQIGIKNPRDVSRALARLNQSGLIPIVKEPRKGQPAHRKPTFPNSVRESTPDSAQNDVCESTLQTPDRVRKSTPNVASDSVRENDTIQCVNLPDSVRETHTRQYKEELDSELDLLLEKALRDFPEMDTPDFREAWGEFLQHRRQQKKRFTQIAAKRQLKTLCEWGPTRAIAAIHHSVGNGWMGIFEKNQGGTGAGGHSNPGKAIREHLTL
jgi:hypothetical protein